MCVTPILGEIKTLCGRTRPSDEASARGAFMESFRGKEDNLTKVIRGKGVSEGGEHNLWLFSQDFWSLRLETQTRLWLGTSSHPNLRGYDVAE